MSTTNISWEGGGKGGRCVGLTTLPPSYASWNPQGLFRPVLELLCPF